MQSPLTDWDQEVRERPSFVAPSTVSQSHIMLAKLAADTAAGVHLSGAARPSCCPEGHLTPRTPSSDPPPSLRLPFM